jgi:hypothetical protein
MGRVFEVTYLSSETVAAINRAIGAGLERNLAGFSALGTNCIIHLTSTTISARVVPLACITAGLTTLRLVGETLFSEKLLFVGGESEFLSAIFADDGFVLKH